MWWHSADRTALPLLGHVEDDDEAIFYVYNAMGLDKQHYDQLVLLGRCRSPLAALALVKACTEKVGMQYRQDRVKYWGGEPPEEAIAQWDAWVRALNLVSGPRRATLRQAFSGANEAEGKIILAQVAAATEL